MTRTLTLLSLLAATAATNAEIPREALDAARARGGLIVHVGCGDADLTATLRAADRCLVHGLDVDAARVRRAREALRKRGLHGPVSVEPFDGSRLPYADNLVNVLVARDPARVPGKEILRVLAPGGAAWVNRAGGWEKTVKPPLDGTDEWTHYLHDASGNPVSHDRVVGPPRRVQWIGGPQHMRCHEHIPSIYTVVSTGGRIFYLVDEAPVASVRTPPRWRLIARDAYNGIVLWKREVGEWFPHIVNWGQTPRQLQRKLVAVGSRVYVTLGLHAPLTAVDAGTGETVRTYAGTAGTEELLCHRGLLLLAIRAVTPDRVKELDKMLAMTRRGKSPLDSRETAEPVVKRFREVERTGPRTILALDAESGRVLWRKTGPKASGLRLQTLSAIGDRVYYQLGRAVTCVDLQTGRERWSTPAGPMRALCADTVACADDQTVAALSAKDGTLRWKQPATLCQLRDAFLINGSLWLGGFKPYQGRRTGKRGPAWGPYFATQRDLATGKLLREIGTANPGHHHRCWQNKATDRYILAGRRGVEFYDLQSGEVRWHSWVRGVCKYGVMPANGLLYAPPHACGCYIAAKLEGFYALAPAEKTAKEEPAAPRLVKGPGSSKTPDSGFQVSEGDWPTYRGDAGRSGRTAVAVPASLRRAWQAEVGGTLTGLTVAGGKVFLASVEQHAVCALDADSGRAAWRFTAGSRVDLPPTIHRGRAVFGCRDGHAYSLRAADGALVWRFRAARRDRRIVARGRLESPSPVPGSVLVQDGVAYVPAGRSSYLDGGIDLHRVEPETGKLLSTTTIYSPDPETGRQPDHFGPCHMPGSLADALTSDGRYVYLRERVMSRDGAVQPKGEAHLFAMTGFLDDSWAHRSYWVFGTQGSMSTGCSGRSRTLIYGRLLAFDDAAVYGYGRSGVHWSNQLLDGPYRLFARERGEAKNRWAKPVPIVVRALLVAGPTVFIAGAADANGKASLIALSAAEGKELARYALDAAPVFDGLAAARGRLYVSLVNGRVICMGPAGAATASR